MKSWIAHIKNSSRPSFELAPKTPLQVIGDIHGRADLLQDLLDRLDPEQPIICVGDYIDRGDQGRAVLELLASRPDIHCIMGNHELMFLSFMAYPARHGARWLRYGGLQTLASFGITGARETSSAEEFEQARDRLLASMDLNLLTWLADLPFWYQNGNVAVVHAGADPALPIGAQSRSWLLWGHPEFRRVPRTDGLCIVYGHKIVDQPGMDQGRIAIDTGGYATGRLTAARISTGKVDFVTTGRG